VFVKIAFAALKNLLRGGGIEKYTLELGRRLVRRGHEVSVYSMSHYGVVEPLVCGMRVIRVPAIRGAATEKLSATASAAVAAVLGAERPDIVHCHSVTAGALGPLFRVRGARTVLQMHGLEWKRSRWNAFGKAVLRALESLSMKRHGAYTAVSMQQCEHYRRAYGVECAYIPTGTEIKEARTPRLVSRMGLEPERYVLFASRLVREKGAHYLIDAFRPLKTDFKLVIAGEAPGERAYGAALRQASRDDPRILFPGYVKGELLEELFSNAAVYVQPSEIEGLSIALLEAMGYARCCLVSDIDENLEAVGDTAVSFEQKSSADLSLKLRTLLEQAEIRREKGAAARQRAQQLYHWDRIADAFEVLYANVLEQQSAPRPAG
jgi:glycosyltransferase involved in cell wall biosynthesis